MYKLYFTALKSLAAKETNRYLRIWIQTLVPPVITTSLYFVIFGNLIGGRIGEIEGFSYMEFIVPGLIMIGVSREKWTEKLSGFVGMLKFIGCKVAQTRMHTFRIVVIFQIIHDVNRSLGFCFILFSW